MSEKNQFDILNASVDQLQTAVNNFAIRFINDEPLRVKYNKLAKQMSEEIYYEVRSGKLTPLQGAEKAQVARNLIMEQIRKITSDTGRAWAEKIKKEGKTLSELEEKYAFKKFERSFQTLSESEKNTVWLEIVKSGGRPDGKTNITIRRWGTRCKVFLAVTIAISVYSVTTADDKAMAAAEEGATLGGGFLGGTAGGAVAGTACGPGAPVCSGIGVFIGGIIGALGGEALFNFFK